MYGKIKEEIKQTYYQQNFSNDGQRFVAWYLKNIHPRDSDQAKHDITDGANVVDDNPVTVYFSSEVNGKTNLTGFHKTYKYT